MGQAAASAGNLGLRRLPSWARLGGRSPRVAAGAPRARSPPAASARGQVHAGRRLQRRPQSARFHSHRHRPAGPRRPGRWSFGVWVTDRHYTAVLLGEEERHARRTLTHPHTQRDERPAWGKPRVPPADPVGPGVLNAKFRAHRGGGMEGGARQRAYRAVRPLFEKETAAGWPPVVACFSSQLQPGQPGSNGRQGRGTGTLTSVAPHAAGDDRCPRRQVACLDGVRRWPEATAE